MRVLVTGANGFVGRAVCERFVRAGAAVHAAVRAPGRAVASGAIPCVVGDLGAATDWKAALEGVDVVVHLAGRVHQMRDTADDSLAAYREVNRVGTERLARAAARSGAKRLVFMSTVKVVGEGRGEPYTERDVPAPVDPYGISKWEAEQALTQVAAETGLEVAILRPPLVYGPSVGANFLKLLQWVWSRLPLPFGSVRNRRSLVYVGNLADAVHATASLSLDSPRTFFVSDGEDVSIPELVRRIGIVLGRPARLVPVPAGVIRTAARLVGRPDAAERLVGSLAVDSTLLRTTTGWRAQFTLDEGLQATAAWFRERG